MKKTLPKIREEYSTLVKLKNLNLGQVDPCPPVNIKQTSLLTLLSQ